MLGRFSLRTHMSFVAVDSMPSMSAGEINWALPKQMSSFDGSIDDSNGLMIAGKDWGVHIKTRRFGPPAPGIASFSCVQVWPDGSLSVFRVRMRGFARLATVELHHETSSHEIAWASPGRHCALRFFGKEIIEMPTPWNT